MCGNITEPAAKTLSLRTLQVRVNKEAKNLDKTRKGWHKLINLPRFDMQFASQCISGQLGLQDSHNEKRGFYLPTFVPLMHKGKSLGAAGVFSEVLKPYKVLTRLWKHQIAIRNRKAAKRKPHVILNKREVKHGC